MAYPTGVNFQPTSGRAGAQSINQSSASKQHDIGEVLQAFDQSSGRGWGTFIYLPGVASNAKGSAVTYNTPSATTALTSSTSKGPAAISMADTGAGQYGWFCIRGNVPVKAATVAADSLCYPTATAGQWDDAVAVSLQVSGARFTSADSGGFADCEISFPSVDTVAGSGGGGGGVTTVGNATGSNAQGLVISGTTINGTIADATNPGLQSSANFTKANAAVTTLAAPSGSNANGGAIAGNTYTASIADATNPGMQSSANFTKANAAATSVGAFSGTSTANVADLTANVLTIHAADATNPGAQSAANFTKTNGLATQRWIAPVVYTPAASSQTGTVGRVYMAIVDVRQRGTATGVAYVIGATIAGNVTVGLYGPLVTEDTAVGCSLIATSNSVAQAGTVSQPQYIAFNSSVVLEPGRYVTAYEGDSATQTYQRMSNLAGPNMGLAQYYDQTYGALASTVPASTNNVSANPCVWLRMQ